MSNSVPISIEVVRGVAAHEGVDPLDLEPPLHEVVDTDALEALVRSTRDSGVTVEFTYCGARVRIDESGAVEVTPPSSDSEGSAAVE
ncbi:HalOD1 output domain-containing protein [Natrinema salaciae]|uniref:Halobacterial output domain-containing protein n=1 Tax=Natrinema salaciae TaxID=1186196 RepID=A0A1H9S1K2_9EURY|nr:HalOD1 output domain-containing protein [Natrinema salaciae]SER78936.1 hypothetical protein SAMN04489841_4548 [Natrinema salaciae]